MTSAFATMRWMDTAARRPRARPRADRAPVADARRRRLPDAASQRGSSRSGFRCETLQSQRRDQPVGAPRRPRPARLLRRAHRRRADRTARRLAADPFEPTRARRISVRPRRGGHEGVARGVRRRDRNVRRQRARARGLDRAADHVRRGRAVDRRHGARSSKSSQRAASASTTASSASRRRSTRSAT